ncbi:MAG: DUF3810 domain-containing protein [Bacteroidota bacterium]
MRKVSDIKKAIRVAPRLRWILLGAGSMLLRLLLAPFPEIVESLYSRGLFVGIRYAHYALFSWWPISLFGPLVLGLLVLLVRRHRRRKRARRAAGINWGWAWHLREAALNVVAFASGVLFVFNVIWGFNYERIPVEKHLGLQVQGLDIEALCEEIEWTARELEKSRRRIPGATDDSLSYALLPPDLNARVNADLQRTLDGMGYPTPGGVRVRVFPGGTYLRLGIAGIYNPFTGEGNLAGALTAPRYPFTMAHEMSHAYGFGDEGTCNLLGLIACTQSEDPFIRYSGLLGYWSYVSGELARIDVWRYRMTRRRLDPGVKADLRANYNNYRRYSGAISRAGKKINDAYLRSMGVKEGISSYNRVVNLFAEWRKR